MSCLIVIENCSEAYSPNSNIEGKVVCVFNAKINVRGIRIKLIGNERTEWKKRKSYYGENKLLEMERILLTEGPVEPGTTEYPFQFTLPNNCSSSYSNKFGRLEYYLKAVVEIPWGTTFENEVTFPVVSLIDLNTITNLNMNPIRYEDEKELCCWCCASGPITLDIYLDKEVFVVGDIMRIKVYCLNMSNRNVKALIIKLNLVIKTKATIPQYQTNKTEEVIAELNESGVEAKCDRHYDLELTIPKDIVIPNFCDCKLLEQWCTLTIQAKLPHFHKDSIITNDIILGHKPVLRKTDVPKQLSAFGFAKSVLSPPYPTRPRIRMPMPTSMPTCTSMFMPSPTDMNKSMNIPISLLTSNETSYFPGQSSKNSIVPYPSGDRMTF